MPLFEEKKKEVLLSQNIVIDNLEVYLNKNGRQLDSFSKDGYCHALASLWALQKIRKNEYAFWNLITAIASWNKKDDIDIYFEKLLAQIEWLQHPSIYAENFSWLTFAENTDFVSDDNSPVFNEEMEIQFLFKENELRDFLSEYLKEGQFALLSARGHAVAVVFEEGKYKFFDANAPNGIVEFDNINDFVNDPVWGLRHSINFLEPEPGYSSALAENIPMRIKLLTPTTKKARAEIQENSLPNVSVIVDKILAKRQDAGAGLDDPEWDLVTSGLGVDHAPVLKQKYNAIFHDHKIKSLSNILVQAETPENLQNMRDTFRELIRAITEDETRNLFLIACEHGHMNGMKSLLNMGASVSNISDADFNNYSDQTKEFLNLERLCQAIKNKSDNIGELIEMNKKNLNSVDSKNQSPLLYAITSGDVNTVELLLQNGANINKAPNKISPLHYAMKRGDKNLIKLLLAHGADVNAVDSDGKQPLLCVKDGETLEYIYHHFKEYGPSLSLDVAGAESEETLLEVAIEKKDVSMVKFILENNPKLGEKENRIGLLPLHIAAIYPNMLPIINELTKDMAKTKINEKGGHYHFTPLHYAVKIPGNIDVVTRLIELGANVNEKSEQEGCAPLHLAAQSGDIEIVKKLIERGAVIDEPNDSNLTAYQMAKKANHPEIMALLLEMGAKENIQEKVNETIIKPLSLHEELHSAVENNQLNRVKELLNKGADVNIKDQNGIPLLHKAVRNGNEDMVTLLLENKHELNVVDRENKSALHIAAEGGQVKMMDMFIKKGSYIHGKASHNFTPLHAAVMNNHTLAAQKLIAAGAQVDAWLVGATREKNAITWGTTPLHLAAMNDNIEMVELLVKTGKANVDVTDRLNRTPLEMTKSPKVSEFLISHSKNAEVKANKALEVEVVKVLQNYSKSIPSSTQLTHNIKAIPKYLTPEEYRSKLDNTIKNFVDAQVHSTEKARQYAGFFNTSSKNPVIIKDLRAECNKVLMQEEKKLHEKNSNQKRLS